MLFGRKKLNEARTTGKPYSIVAELDAESAQIDAVRTLIPRFEAKIQGVMDRVWGIDLGIK
jgi:hypothetical protein